MGLFARFWQYSVDTYGGAPLLLLINLIQIAILAWVVIAVVRSRSRKRAAAAASLSALPGGRATPPEPTRLKRTTEA